MESMFLSAIDMHGNKLCQDSLQKLILFETSIFDVLHSFFFHQNLQVRQAALEVYVRRSYIAYELNSVQHYFLTNNDCLVEFQLQLPSNHPNCILSHMSKAAFNSYNSMRSSSLSNNTNDLSIGLFGDPLQFQRMGKMAAFNNWEIAQKNFDEMIARYRTEPTLSKLLLTANSNNNLNSSTISSNNSTNSPTFCSNNNNNSSINCNSNLSPTALNEKANIDQSSGNSNNQSIIRNVPSVGILRAQQYESIASNMNSYADNGSAQTSVINNTNEKYLLNNI